MTLSVFSLFFESEDELRVLRRSDNIRYRLWQRRPASWRSDYGYLHLSRLEPLPQLSIVLINKTLQCDNYNRVLLRRVYRETLIFDCEEVPTNIRPLLY